MFEEWLSPVSSSLLEKYDREEGEEIGAGLYVHDEIAGFPNWEKCKIAILGICEGRGSASGKVENTPDLIRKKFYDLYPGDWIMGVADLGNLYAGERHQDTQIALRDILAEVLSKQVILIVLGGSQDLTYGMYRGYDKLEQRVNIAAIDSRFDLGRHDQSLSEENYVSHIILNKPYNLFNLSTIGYQSYLIKQEERGLMERMNFDLVRLGDIRSDLKLAEPLMRDADLVSIDLASMKRSGARACHRAGPNGFLEEDLCILSRYSGISDKVSSIGFFGLDSEHIEAEQTADLVAQALWYFLEGVDSRKGDYPFASKKDYLRFSVLINEGEQELVFYKSPLSGRWWMEVPIRNRNLDMLGNFAMVPCSDQDYERACENEIPDRWWKAYHKGL